jgi:hypothetical protein
MCEMVDESVGLHNGQHAVTPWVSREDLPWGTHASEGIVAVTGAHASDIEGKAADIAPTILALLGLEVEDLDGRSLVPPPPDATRVSGGPAQSAQRVTDEDVYTPDQEAAVLEQLRGLGYVD